MLGDLYEILKAAPETTRMAHILNRLVNGSASTFNKATNVRLDNKYTVLDISSLTGDLLTVGMFVVLDFVWDRAKADRTEEKAIFIDECWQLLSGAGATGTRLAGDFVLEISKPSRLWRFSGLRQPGPERLFQSGRGPFWERHHQQQQDQDHPQSGG